MTEFHYGPDVPLEQRFWERVEITPTCWLWKAALAAVDHGDGYGHFAYQGKHYGAHRYSWELANGPIPKGLHVLHRCDVRRCVNPAHLFLGTAKDNMSDASRKGRMHLGELDGIAKLNPAKVRAARAYVAAGGGYTAIGRLYGVCEGTIRSLIEGRTWSHVA